MEIEPVSRHAPIRALFLDLDGTLIDFRERVSPGVLRAIEAARQRGCTVVCCTGRTSYTALPIAEQLAPPLGYAVVSNGGVVLHLESREVLLRQVMPIPLALEIARIIVDLGGEPYIYEDAVSSHVDFSRVLYHPELPVGEWATPPRYRPHPTLLDDLPFTPVSVSTFGKPERMHPFILRLRERLPAGVSIIESGTMYNWGVEIYIEGVSKRHGAETLAAHLGVAREEVMAVGDHRNDIDMIAWAGIGVAMGNALPEVKATADWITGTVDEDGVAQAIEHFVL
jgi:Cof subfamily protein (haloacid dehalogenase superfamily)